MIYLVSDPNRYIGRLDEVTDNLISPGFFVYMYARKEAPLSSQIDGTRATFSELIKAEAGIADEDPNDVAEIENDVRATSYGFERLETLPLSFAYAGHTFTATGLTAGNVSNALKIDIAAYVAPTSGSSSGGGGGSSTTSTTGHSTVNVVVNGKTENAGTETKSTEDGKSTVTVTLKFLFLIR